MIYWDGPNRVIIVSPHINTCFSRGLKTLDPCKAQSFWFSVVLGVLDDEQDDGGQHCSERTEQDVLLHDFSLEVGVSSVITRVFSAQCFLTNALTWKFFFR